jgi:hypothetical protein
MTRGASWGGCLMIPVPRVAVVLPTVLSRAPAEIGFTFHF